MSQNIPHNILELLNDSFFSRVVLASLEVIYLLNTRDSLLYETFHTGAGGDQSSGADLLAEAIFCKFLLPHYHIDSEESGFIQGDISTNMTVVLDPLDGSSNFKSHIPYYGASIALCDSNGKVKEACVVNYISREIAYLNDDLLKISKTPYIFMLNTSTLVNKIGLDIAITKKEDNQTRIGNEHQYQNLSYYPIDFSILFDCQNNSNKELYIQKICDKIIDTKQQLPTFNRKFLYEIFYTHIVQYCHENIMPHKSTECGIFEKVTCHDEWLHFLYQHGFKFRSLGATALSLGFSFRYLFVLLPNQVRRYDGMAGFYLAQNQIIYGNVEAFCNAIPILQNSIKNTKHIIIATNSNVANKFIGW